MKKMFEPIEFEFFELCGQDAIRTSDPVPDKSDDETPIDPF